MMPFETPQTKFRMMLLLFPISGVSVDCPNIIALADSLNMQTAQPTMYSPLVISCCNQVICDGNQRVTKIPWSSLGLTGSINAAYLPDTLKQLYLDNNQITGSLPTSWPPGLITIYLINNRFTGSVPSGSSLPPGLGNLYLSGNMLTGSAPSQLPNTLLDLDLSRNL
eukprot:NODE_526_length_7226_cov_0.465273.p5 type:complete len:167 gc:universal NODE_526_length_7226_cov_0.465273:2403-2903(+)